MKSGQPSSRRLAGRHAVAAPNRAVVRGARRLAGDSRGAVLIETAILLPVLLMLLVGIINYGLFFMAAHAVQQAANEGARASLAGLDSSERNTLAGEAVQQSLAAAGVVNPALVTTTFSVSGGFYTVRISYDVARTRLFASAFLPLPRAPIQRASVVKMVTM